MEALLPYFIYFTLFGFLISLLIPRSLERLLSGVAIATTSVSGLTLLAFIFYWIYNGFPVLNNKHFVLFQTDEVEIFIDFLFDEITALFAFVGVVLTFLVAVFSRYYLHRDEGFKRFFNLLLLFFFSYNVLIFSGNFETLFVGWEILGLCSFLLISFYRDRYLPVRNSLKVISLYRLGDICLILAMWMSHHLWHLNITFVQLQDTLSVQQHLIEHQNYAIFIGCMIVVASAVKSAQFPFTSWLPRALEGPTTSSAIFYGSLSVHIGVFLLLRTAPYWNGLIDVKVLIFFIGVITTIVATSVARVQSTVKTQIAYASAAQIGLIFCEIALGFHWIALLHFVGNASFRTYQLLVSPSVLGYKIHDQFFSFIPKNSTAKNSIPSLFNNSLYVLSVKEWNMDYYLQKLLWNPFKTIGNFFHRFRPLLTSAFLVLFFILGFIFLYYSSFLPTNIQTYIPHFCSGFALISIIVSFTEKNNALFAWNYANLGQLFMALSIALLNEDFGQNHILLYLGGSLASAIIGYCCLFYLRRKEGHVALSNFYGHVYEYPKLATVFLIACLGFIGLPFTPTFIGIDILFNHIHKHEEIIILFTALSYLILELSILRIYARLFLGPHTKAYHPIAFRSS